MECRLERMWLSAACPAVMHVPRTCSRLPCYASSGSKPYAVSKKLAYYRGRIVCLLGFVGYRDIPTVANNQMENNTENQW